MCESKASAAALGLCCPVLFQPSPHREGGEMIDAVINDSKHVIGRSWQGNIKLVLSHGVINCNVYVC